MNYIYLDAKPFLKNKVYQLFIEVAGAVESRAQFNWSLKNISDEMQQSRFFIAIESEQQGVEELREGRLSVVAFVAFRRTQDFDEIMALGTKPGRAGQGHMTQLLQKFCLDAQSGGRGVVLEVHEGNQPAIKLYEKLGFQRLSKRNAYYSDGKAAYVMGLNTDYKT